MEKVAVSGIFDSAKEDAANYPLPSYTPFLAALVGATAGCLSGRERTRLDNFLIGGLFTGSVAFRDPRANVAETLVVAALEGLIWGITDRLIPELKDKLLPAEAEHVTA